MAEAQLSVEKRNTKEVLLARRQELADWERQGYEKLGPLSSKLEEVWIDIPLNDGWKSRTLVVHPKRQKDNTLDEIKPLLVHFYGGGYGAGSPIQMAHPARLFAERFNATVLLPSYRHVPENPWPQPQKDGLEVVQKIAANSEYHYGADPTHGFIANTRSLSPLTGAFLSISMFFVDEILPDEYRKAWTSREDNRHAELFDTAAIDDVLFNLNCTDYTSPWFSPVNLFTSDAAPRGHHPPTYLQAGGLDPLRDDAIIYERILAKAGVLTKIHVFPEEFHTTLSNFNVLFGTESKNPSIEEGTMEGIEWLLEQGGR